MSVEIAWKQNILDTDFHLLKSLLAVFGFGSQAFVCGFSRQNINSVPHLALTLQISFIYVWVSLFCKHSVVRYEQMLEIGRARQISSS